MHAEQLDLGQVLKEQGMERVLTHTKEEWKDRFRSAASSILKYQGSVTSEEVVAIIGMPPGHPNAVGASMNAFAREHKLWCSYEKSNRVSCHKAIIGRWRETKH